MSNNTVALKVSCKNLPPLEEKSEDTPSLCAVLYYKIESETPEEFSRTEPVEYDPNPTFPTSLAVKHLYRFGVDRRVQIRIYSAGKDAIEQSVGQIETTVGQIVSQNPLSLSLEKDNGEVIPDALIDITTEDVTAKKEIATFNFKARKLDDKDYFFKSDAFYEISKLEQDGSWKVVFKSEVISNNLNPDWKPFHVRVTSLFEKKESPIKIAVYDWSTLKSHSFIGSFITTLEELNMAVDSEVSWPCINEELRAKKKDYKSSGQIVLTEFRLQETYSFFDYILGGLQINMAVGVDFTESNGNPDDKDSNHFFSDEVFNQYQQSIFSVGQILQDYSSDKKIPVFGFGARLQKLGHGVFQDFSVNLDRQNPFCNGIEGVLDAYTKCVKTVYFSGPSCLAPTIKRVAGFAQKTQEEEQTKGASNYTVLLLVIHGRVSDMTDVCDAIVTASALPLSVIILRTGFAAFDDMDALKGDHGVLKSSDGKPVVRDIVQFSQCADFSDDQFDQLAGRVLGNIPSQIMDYFNMRGLQPKNRRQPPPPTPEV